MNTIESKLFDIVYQYSTWNDCDKSNYFETSTNGIELVFVSIQGERKYLQGIEFNADESLTILWSNGTSDKFSTLAFGIKNAIYKAIKKWYDNEQLEAFMENSGEGNDLY